jgi:hypothetical protein
LKPIINSNHVVMKKFPVIAAALVFGLMSFSVLQTQPVQPSVVAVSSITWTSEVIDLGEIPQGTPKTVEFEFKNSGKTNVIITDVKASCGCTAADYTKAPIKPGGNAKVAATYNAAAKGPFSKTLTVTTNAETTPKVLTIKGTVI